MPPTGGDIQIRIQTLGADASVNQLTSLRREVRGLYNDAKTGSAEQKELGNQLNYLNGRVKELNPNFNQMRAHTRAARQESFMFRFAVTELLTPLTEFAGLNKRVVQEMQAVVGAGLSVKFGLDMLGGGFAALSTPIAIIISAYAAYKTAANMVKQTEDELAKATETRIDLLYKLGRLTDQEMERIKTRAVESAKQSAKGAGGGFFDNLIAYLAGTISGGGIAGGVSAVAVSISNEQTQADNKVLQAQLDEKTFIIKENENELKYLKELAEAGKLSRAQLIFRHDLGLISDRAFADLTEYMRSKSANVRAASSLVAGTGPGKISLGSTMAAGVRPGESPTIAGATFSDVLGESRIFESSFKTGMMSSAAAIDQYIGGTFEKVFGQGTNLLKSFVSSFVSSFINIGMGILSGGLWNIISGGSFFSHAGGGVINEPIVGRGLWSGSTHTFGERGPEQITPMFQGSRDGYVFSSPIVLETRIRGNDIVLVQARASNARNKRIM